MFVLDLYLFQLYIYGFHIPVVCVCPSAMSDTCFRYFPNNNEFLWPTFVLLWQYFEEWQFCPSAKGNCQRLVRCISYHIFLQSSASFSDLFYRLHVSWSNGCSADWCTSPNNQLHEISQLVFYSVNIINNTIKSCSVTPFYAYILLTIFSNIVSN